MRTALSVVFMYLQNCPNYIISYKRRNKFICNFIFLEILLRLKCSGSAMIRHRFWSVKKQNYFSITFLIY